LPGSHSKFTDSVYSAAARGSNHAPPRFPLEPQSQARHVAARLRWGGLSFAFSFLANGGSLLSVSRSSTHYSLHTIHCPRFTTHCLSPLFHTLPQP
jgi:hypothetical protein